MRSFLQRFAPVVLGVLSGFDRIIFKGRLPQLYSPQGMNCYASANRVLLVDFKKHAKEITQHVMQASLVEKAKAVGCFQYLNSGKTSKDETARRILEQRPVGPIGSPDLGLAAVLQRVEPSWTFDVKR